MSSYSLSANVIFLLSLVTANPVTFTTNLLRAFQSLAICDPYLRVLVVADMKSQNGRNS